MQIEASRPAAEQLFRNAAASSASDFPGITFEAVTFKQSTACKGYVWACPTFTGEATADATIDLSEAIHELAAADLPTGWSLPDCIEHVNADKGIALRIGFFEAGRA